MMRRTVLILLVLAGCGEPAPVRATMLATPSALQIGDTVFLRLVYRNRSSTPQRLEHGACGPWFSVMDELRRLVPVPPRPCIDVLLSATVAPGDSVVFNDLWTGVEAWLAGSQGTSVPKFVRPGDYLLFPSRMNVEVSGHLVAVKVLP